MIAKKYYYELWSEREIFCNLEEKLVLKTDDLKEARKQFEIERKLSIGTKYSIIRINRETGKRIDMPLRTKW